MGYGWHNEAMGSGWWVLMAIGMFVFLAAFVIGGVLLVRRTERPPVAASATAPSAIDILQQRFARGEMSEEEYTRAMTLLKGTS